MSHIKEENFKNSSFVSWRTKASKKEQTRNKSVGFFSFVFVAEGLLPAVAAFVTHHLFYIARDSCGDHG